MPASSRTGTVIILVLGLVVALLLLGTMFLVEVLGMRSSNREYLRRNLARFAAEAGREHAIAVLNYQYKDEWTNKGATTEVGPWREAFIPAADGSGNLDFAAFPDMEVPTYDDTGDRFDGSTSMESTSHIWSMVAGWGSLNNRTAKSEVAAWTHGIGYVGTSRWAPWYHSRFIDFAHYDIDLEPVDPVAAPDQVAFRARYDVAISSVDPMFSIRPDFGPDEYRLPTDASIFGYQDSVVFNTGNSNLSSTDPEIDTRRDMKWQYLNMYARSLASILASDPQRTFDGMPAARVWSEVVIETDGSGNQYVYPAPGATWWVYGTGGGDPGSDLAHLDFEASDRYNQGTDAGDYWRRSQYDYHSDETRHTCDLFLGVGLGRASNENKVFNHHLDLLTWHEHGTRRGDQDGALLLKYDAPSPQVLSGEHMYTPKQAIANIHMSHTHYDEVASFEQYSPYGSGIVGHDTAVDSTRMDLGGVPWEINALSAPKTVLKRLVVGLSMQLGYADSIPDWEGDSISTTSTDTDGDGDNETVINTLSTKENGTGFNVGWREGKVTARGYHLGNPRNAGSHAFELLWDPPMADGSSHSFESAIRSRYSGKPYLEDMAFAGLNPFYDPGKASASQENAEQLYNYLDGLWAPDGTASSDQARDRFFNRLNYIRWLSWKHEFCSGSAIIEQRLMELDAAVTYEEGLRYYRRPDGRTLRRDIGDTDERDHFDGRREQMGVELTSSWTAVTNPHTGSSDNVGARVTDAYGTGNTIADLVGTTAPASKNDGDLRYRVFPHTYPSPLWTGREGRWDASGTGWSGVSIDVGGDQESYGNGTSEALHSQYAGYYSESRGSGDSCSSIQDHCFSEYIRNKVGDGTLSRRGVDAFGWDIGMAIYLALGEARDTANSEYAAGSSLTPTIASIDERAMNVLFGGTLANYGFGNNLVVTHLYNPVEPVDVNGDGNYDPSVDVVNVDFDGDGVNDLTGVPAIRDPEYIYGEYNLFWPVSDPAIPHPDLDPATFTGPMTIGAARDMMNGKTASPNMTSWKLGAHYDEITDTAVFTSDDFYYHHPRALFLASMMVNDFRQSLFGAGSPATLADFKVTAAADLTVGASMAQLDLSAAGGAAGSQIFVAGRNQDPTTGTPRPFSRTGRLVIKPDRFFRVQVRAHLVNESLNPAFYEQDLVESYLDFVYCTDPNEDGSVDDGRVIHQRFKNASRRHRRNDSTTDL